MADIVTLAGKGSALTYDELDANFQNLNAGVLTVENTLATQQATIDATLAQAESIAVVVQTSAGAAETARTSAEAAWTAALAANPDLNPSVRMNPSTITEDLTIPTGYNAYSAGPLTIGEDVEVTLEDHSNWSVL